MTGAAPLVLYAPIVLLAIRLARTARARRRAELLQYVFDYHFSALKDLTASMEQAIARVGEIAKRVHAALPDLVLAFARETR